MSDQDIKFQTLLEEKRFNELKLILKHIVSCITKEDNPDDVKFERLLEEKRHNDFLNTLKNILETKNDNQEIKDIFDKQSTAIEGFIEMIKNYVLNNKEQTINIETNNLQIIESVKEIGEMIVRSQENLKSEMIKLSTPKKWEFSINRDSNLFIESIIAKQIQ